MKPGDKVVCVNPDPNGCLRILGVYTVRKTGTELIGVTEFNLALWDKSRFILLDSPVGLQTLSQETKES